MLEVARVTRVECHSLAKELKGALNVSLLSQDEAWREGRWAEQIRVKKRNGFAADGIFDRLHGLVEA